MELYINNMEKGRVINTTKGGAKIKSTDFKELKDIISNDLQERVVFENQLDGDRTNYNKEEIKNKVKLMDIELEETYRCVN